MDWKAVLFDMDGVLYDSMPSHAEAWAAVMAKHGYRFSREDAYLNEGRTGAATIRLVCEREGISLSEREIEALYDEKMTYFRSLPAPGAIPGVYDLLKKVTEAGLEIMVVTGSGHADLTDRLNRTFPGIAFRRDRMITAFDVTHGKPHPEPYLMALDWGGWRPWEAIAVENAPLGIASALAAGLFTIAVNTGPLPDACLLEAGAHLLFHTMAELAGYREELAAGFLSVKTPNAGSAQR
ncbi:MAG: HAD hydrolase-like protein [Tannerella sp.]|jgi:beta-phosphoglucomutase-like phosphatase (HAD superfamily)|nr:HAD hydrolase-like protein [Tannerella sp.]